MKRSASLFVVYKRDNTRRSFQEAVLLGGSNPLRASGKTFPLIRVRSDNVGLKWCESVSIATTVSAGCAMGGGRPRGRHRVDRGLRLVPAYIGNGRSGPRSSGCARCGRPVSARRRTATSSSRPAGREAASAPTAAASGPGDNELRRRADRSSRALPPVQRRQSRGMGRPARVARAGRNWDPRTSSSRRDRGRRNVPWMRFREARWSRGVRPPSRKPT